MNDYNTITENVGELTTIKMTNEITSKLVSAWARGVEAQRTQKALMEATKVKNLTLWEGKSKNNNACDKSKSKQKGDMHKL